jgi:chromosome segregation ATPase
MSDNPQQQILDALTRLEAGQTRLEANQARLEANQTRLEANQTHLEANQTRLEAGQNKMRSEIMDRIDRLQTRFDSLNDLQTLFFGSFDRIEHRHNTVSEDNRLLGQQMMILTRMVQRLGGRIDDIEEPKS